MEICRLLVLGSSSDGNCYILDCGTEKLIIEAGVKDNIVLNALNYEVGNVGAVLCTHR